MVNLLLRLYDVQGGRILIDGQDIAKVSQASLRAQIGMITQDTSLLHRSIRDNLLYGRPDASEAQLHEAVRRARADEFIPQLSDARGAPVSMPMWVSAGSSCRAANASVSPSPGCC